MDYELTPSDDPVAPIPQPQPALRSRFNDLYLLSRLKVFFFILLPIFIVAVKLNGHIAIWLIIFIPFVVMMMFLSFTLRQFYYWTFAETSFTRRNLVTKITRTYFYTDISTWQIRKRLGTRSRNETIPNYEEIAIWMSSKASFSFDEIEYSNYRSMRDFFEQKCTANGIEMAEYHE